MQRENTRVSVYNTSLVNKQSGGCDRGERKVGKVAGRREEEEEVDILEEFCLALRIKNVESFTERHFTCYE